MSMSKALLQNVRRSTRVAKRGLATVISSSDVEMQRKKARLDVEGSQIELKKRQKKTARSSNPDDYPSRVPNSWKIGAHVSVAGGISNSVLNAAAVGANAFGLFLKSQMKWTSPALSEVAISLFKSRLESFGYSPSDVLPHGNYLINLGNPDKEKRDKSYECFLDDLRRCEQLDLPLYNFHPGSTVGQTSKESSITLIAQCINRAHKETNSVITVIENMAGAGNIVGATFSDLADIIRQVEDKERVGVCLDTCHLFAAGYDIRSKGAWESTMAEFDLAVGVSFLRAMHFNGSKHRMGSKLDRHLNVGMGEFGIHTFCHILTDPRTQNIPLILETPSFETDEIWEKEIDVLNRIAATGGSGLDLDNLATDIKSLVKRYATSSSSPSL